MVDHRAARRTKGQRVTVRRSIFTRQHAWYRIAAASVLDKNRLTPTLRQSFGKQTPDDVSRLTRRKRNNNSYGFVWIRGAAVLRNNASGHSEGSYH